MLRRAFIAAFALALMSAGAEAADCPADRAIYARQDGERFVVLRYGEVEHDGGRPPVPEHPARKFTTPVQEGTFKGRRLMSYVDTATGGTGFPGSHYSGEDPEWEKLIVWKKSTQRKAASMVPMSVASGPIAEPRVARWTLVGCR